MNLQQCVSTKSGKFVCGNGGIIGFEPDPENVVITKDSHMVLNHLFFPTKEGLTENINANLFDDIEILGKICLPDNLIRIGNTNNAWFGCGPFTRCSCSVLEIPPLVIEIGDSAFVKCKIGILKLYPRVLSTKYARQLKGAKIENLYLLESHIPLSHKWGILDSIACNADVGNIYVGDANHLIHIQDWRGLYSR